MRTRITKLSTIAFVLVFLLSASTALLAQSSDQRTNIQIYGSALQYDGDLEDQFFESNKLEWGGGINLNRYLTPAFDAGLHLTYGGVESKMSDLDRFDSQLGTVMLAVRLKMYGNILKEDAFIGPYLQVGGGGAWAKTDAITNGVVDRKSVV